MEYIHKPVLLDECIAMLNIRPDGVYIDGTLGRAGHSKEIARRLTTGRLVCIDQDLAAIRAAGYDLTTAVLISEPEQVEIVKTGETKALDKILTVQ